jgi:hypothetical protein
MLTERKREKERFTVRPVTVFQQQFCRECANILCVCLSVCLSTPQLASFTATVTYRPWKYSARRRPLLNKEILSCGFIAKDYLILECFKNFSCNCICSHHHISREGMVEFAWRVWSRTVDYRNIASQSPFKPRNISVKVKESHNRPGVVPEGSRRFRIPDFLHIQHTKVVMSSASRTDRPYHHEMFVVLIFTRGLFDPRAIERSEGIFHWKIPVTPPRIDPGAVRLVAQHLNHFANPDPKISIALVMADKRSSKHCVADECRHQSEGFSTYVVFIVVDCQRIWLVFNAKYTVCICRICKHNVSEHLRNLPTNKKINLSHSNLTKY